MEILPVGMWLLIIIKGQGLLWTDIIWQAHHSFTVNFCRFFSNWIIHCYFRLKFMFSKKATKIDEIFTVDLTLCSKCQIDGEDFVNFCGLLRKHEL